MAVNTTQATKKNINLQYFLASDIPGYLLGDDSRLRQILLNLMGNAIKFTPSGNVFVSVKSKLINKDQEITQYELMITIQDQGIGIDGDRITQLFQPFIQADASISRKYGGTGLGLAISKSLINLMGGTIWVESLGNVAGNPPDNWASNIKTENYQGSIFYFTFIAKEVLTCDLIVEDSVKPVENFSEVNIKILLAEDNKVNQKVVTLTLKKLGYSADIANNGLEVLEMLEKQFYDVILMDMQMPEMDGVTATKKIRESSQRQPYIIALTANVLEEDKEICLQAGMNDFIRKPLSIPELKNALNNTTL